MGFVRGPDEGPLRRRSCLSQYFSPQVFNSVDDALKGAEERPVGDQPYTALVIAVHNGVSRDNVQDWLANHKANVVLVFSTASFLASGGGAHTIIEALCCGHEAPMELVPNRISIYRPGDSRPFCQVYMVASPAGDARAGVADKGGLGNQLRSIYGVPISQFAEPGMPYEIRVELETQHLHGRAPVHCLAEAIVALFPKTGLDVRRAAAFAKLSVVTDLEEVAGYIARRCPSLHPEPLGPKAKGQSGSAKEVRQGLFRALTLLVPGAVVLETRAAANVPAEEANSLDLLCDAAERHFRSGEQLLTELVVLEGNGGILKPGIVCEVVDPQQQAPHAFLSVITECLPQLRVYPHLRCVDYIAKAEAERKQEQLQRELQKNGKALCFAAGAVGLRSLEFTLSELSSSLPQVLGMRRRSRFSAGGRWCVWDCAGAVVVKVLLV